MEKARTQIAILCIATTLVVMVAVAVYPDFFRGVAKVATFIFTKRVGSAIA